MVSHFKILVMGWNILEIANHRKALPIDCFGGSVQPLAGKSAYDKRSPSTLAMAGTLSSLSRDANNLPDKSDFSSERENYIVKAEVMKESHYICHPLFNCSVNTKLFSLPMQSGLNFSALIVFNVMLFWKINFINIWTIELFWKLRHVNVYILI